MAIKDKSLRKNRDFTLLLGGSTINSIGDWLLELALPLYVFIETGSGLSTAAVYLAGLAIGLVFGPLGGSLADRWNLRVTLVATNLLQIAALSPLLLVDSERIWPIYFVVVLQGLISSVNDPASFALLPGLVSDEQLLQANSAMSAGGSIARLIGAAAGGVAVAAGGLTVVIIADSATFVVGALAAWFMSRKRTEARSESAPSEGSDSSIRAGLREVRSRSQVSALIWIQALAMVGFGAFPILFIAFVTTTLEGGPSEVGLIRASSAAGGLLAAGVISGLAAKRHPARVMVGGYFLFAVLVFAFANAPSVSTALGIYVVLFPMSGFPNVATSVGMTSSVQLFCPPKMHGRVGGLMSAAGSLGFGIGALAGGLLLGTFTARTLFNVQSAILLGCGLIGLFYVVPPAPK